MYALCCGLSIPICVVAFNGRICHITLLKLFSMNFFDFAVWGGVCGCVCVCVCVCVFWKLRVVRNCATIATDHMELCPVSFIS